MLRSLRRRAAIAGWSVVLLLGLVMAVAGAGGLIEGSDEPSMAGKGRLHSPFVEEVKCSRPRTAEICDRLPSVKLDLPDATTEDVSQDALHALVRREGPIAVDVEWVENLGSATRVRYEGRWYRAAHVADANTFENVMVLLLGLGLIFFGGVRVLDRWIPDGAAAAESDAAA